MAQLGTNDYISYLNAVLGMWHEWPEVPPTPGLELKDVEAHKQKLMQLSQDIMVAEQNLIGLQIARRFEMKAINSFAARLRRMVLAIYDKDSTAAKFVPRLYHKQTVRAAHRRAKVRAEKADAEKADAEKAAPDEGTAS